jgi:LCP family protein required for cell wall assembly
MLFCVGGAGYAAMLTGVLRSTVSDLFASGDYADPVDGQYNILLLGGDAGPDRMGMRPDSISVVSINADTGATTMIGVPRNFERAVFSEGSPLWEPFPDGYDCGDDCLINYLYTYGEEHPELYPDAVANGSSPGVEATRDAVAGVTGLTLQYFVVIDMQGFADLVDSLGGVTIDVPARTNIAPIEATEPYFTLEAGSQHMDGGTALWYARSRYETTDYERMERQRQVQEAIVTQFTPANVLSKFQGIASAGVQVINTDVPKAMLPAFLDLANRARVLPITKLELVPGVVETVYPDFDVIHALVQATLHPEGE